jgi:hypothetical protein
VWLHDSSQVFTLTRQLDTAPGVTALKALAANHQLVTLLLDDRFRECHRRVDR